MEVVLSFPADLAPGVERPFQCRFFLSERQRRFSFSSLLSAENQGKIPAELLFLIYRGMVVIYFDNNRAGVKSFLAQIISLWLVFSLKHFLVYRKGVIRFGAAILIPYCIFLIDLNLVHKV